MSWLDRRISDLDVLIIGTNEPDKLLLAGAKEEIELYEKIKSELINFGLTPNEARIYMYLARVGPMRAGEISKSLRIHRTEAYHLLNSLQNKGLVSVMLQRPAKFSAISFDKALDTLVQTEKERLIIFEEKKPQLIELWQSLPKRVVANDPEEKFQILGVEQAYVRAREMSLKAKDKVCIMGSEIDMARMDQFGILDEIIKVRNRGVIFQLLMSLSHRCRNGIKEIINHVKIVQKQVESLPHFIISDSRELLFFIKRNNVRLKEIKALWTNYKALIDTMLVFFDELWQEAFSPNQFYFENLTNNEPLRIT